MAIAFVWLEQLLVGATFSPPRHRDESVVDVCQNIFSLKKEIIIIISSLILDLFQGLNPSFQGLQPSFQGPPSHPATVAILFGLSGWALSSGRRVSYGGLEAHVAGLPFHNIDFFSRQARH